MKRHLLPLVLLSGLLTAAACSSNDNHGSGLGTFSLTWQLVVGSSTISCANADAVTLQVTSHPVGSGTDIIDAFDCSDMAGTTDPLTEGIYDVSVDLLDSNDDPLNNETQDLGRHTIIQDTDLDLGHVVFDFTG